MSANVNAEADAKVLVALRLKELMQLFAENHKYLSSALFILRKRDTEEQATLFGA